MAYMDTNTRQLERCAPGLETRRVLYCLLYTSGDEIDVTPIFFSIHAGFRAFQGRFFKIAPPWMSNPQKSKNSKNRLLVTAQEGGFFIF